MFNTNTFKLILFFAYGYFIFGQDIRIPKNLEKILDKSGISKSDIDNVIRNNSVSEEKIVPDIDKSVFDELAKIDASNNEIEIVTGTIDSKDLGPVLNTTANVDAITSDEDDINLGNKNVLDDYFGYSIFKGNPEVFQDQLDLSVDPNYVVGFGDEIIVMLWGETESYNEYEVSKDGYIFVKNIGQIFVNGLNIDKIEKKLYKNLKKVYSTLGDTGGGSSTYLDVTLGKSSLRPVRIFALGEVKQPGAYEIKSSATLFSSLYYFNGPTIQGSLRDIRLLRNGKEITTIDYYDYIISGKQKGDVKIQRGDVVFIPPRGRTIKLIGEINKPLIFELAENESLEELIKYAGGLKSTTYTDRAQIKRIVPSSEREKGTGDRMLIDFSLNNNTSELKNLRLFDGDEITFFKITDEVNNDVTVEGAVFRAGSFGIGEGLNVRQLIEKADGLTADAYRNKAYILRENFKTRIPEQIAIDLNVEMADTNKIPTILQPGDVLKIDFISELFFQSNFSITGHVKKPGVYKYREGTTVYDLIHNGGGFKDQRWINEAYLERSELFRLDPISLERYMIPFDLDSVLSNTGISNIQLMRGDSIHIYDNETALGLNEKTVRVFGYVKQPKDYIYFKGMTAYDLLFSAGGIADDIFMKKTYMNRADLVRYNENEGEKEITSFSLKNLLLNRDTSDNFSLRAGDAIRIYSESIYKKPGNVILSGQISTPGSYELKSEMTLADLILESGGVNPEFKSFRVDITRLDEDGFSSSSVTKYFSNDSSIFNQKNNFFLMPEDKIKVRVLSDYFKTNQVSIAGEVNYPGDYEIPNKNFKISDLIELSGGLTHDAFAMASRFIRKNDEIRLSFEKILKNQRSKDNIILSSGDSVFIGARTEIVKVQGQVRNPGNLQYIKNKKVNDYIDLSGGLTKQGSLFEITITYPNGTTKSSNPFGFSPTVYDGSIINVGQKVEREKFKITEYAIALTDIYAEFVQALMLIRLVDQN